MNLTEVLFPTDFSPSSEAAGRVAREMARQWGARLHIVHVVPPVTDPFDTPERLRRTAASLGDGLRVETALLSGRIAHQIIDYARAKRVGLIVLGTHGRTGVSRVLIGSVAESVVRLAPCLVLTVPEAAFAPAVGAPAAMMAPSTPRCIVCAGATEELICETCRARIRGEALERKIEAERPGRRGTPS
jgi:nucleotide-binding universal stress UspA family protein